MSRLLTTGEVAARLFVTRQTVNRWVRRGLIPVVILPSGARRIDSNDLELAKTNLKAVNPYANAR